MKHKIKLSEKELESINFIFKKNKYFSEWLNFRIILELGNLDDLKKWIDKRFINSIKSDIQRTNNKKELKKILFEISDRLNRIIYNL